MSKLLLLKISTRLANVSLALVLAVLVWSQDVFAEGKFFIEPYVGLGKLELEFESGSGLGSFKEIANGFFIGGKLGVQVSRQFFLAGDYQVSGPYQFDESLDDAEWNHKMLGLGIGADYKVIRFFAGYYFDSEFDDSKNNFTISGKAIKIGFGLLASNKLRANLDLIFYTLDDIEFDGGGSADIDNNIKAESTHVSISIPIEF